MIIREKEAVKTLSELTLGTEIATALTKMGT
jgi:hypothetical protein